MPLKLIYKNLYYDTQTSMYYFVRGRDVRPVVDQQSYLLIYMIELMKKEQDERKTRMRSE